MNDLMHKRTLMLVLLATAMVAAGIPLASASGITCRSGGIGTCLNGNDHFDWTRNYGPPFSPIPNGSFAQAFTAGGAFVNFAQGGNGERVDQGNGWNGNFTRGDELLWTNSPGQGPLTFTFEGFFEVYGAGANIQTDFFGPFTALIQAFDVFGNLIDSFSENGNSNPNGDGSAIFIGLQDQGFNFSKVTFSITSCVADCNNFAINQLDINYFPEGVPEPASLLLLGTGLFSLAGGARKLFRKRS